MSTRKKKSLLPVPRKPEVRICSLTLTEAAADSLARLRQETSDYIGRTVSASAIARALLVFAADQSPQWTYQILCPLIEEEFQQGLLWGKQPPKPKASQ